MENSRYCGAPLASSLQGRHDLRDATLRAGAILPHHPGTADHLRLRRPTRRPCPRQTPARGQIQPKLAAHDALLRRTTHSRSRPNGIQAATSPNQAGLRPVGSLPRRRLTGMRP